MILYKTLFQTVIAIFTPIAIIYAIAKIICKVFPEDINDEKEEEK